jgi:hypothetical protein
MAELASLDLMPPARVIAGPRALLTSILLVTRVPCRGSGAGGRPSHINNACGGRSFPGSTGKKQSRWVLV